MYTCMVWHRWVCHKKKSNGIHWKLEKGICARLFIISHMLICCHIITQKFGVKLSVHDISFSYVRHELSLFIFGRLMCIYYWNIFVNYQCLSLMHLPWSHFSTLKDDHWASWVLHHKRLIEGSLAEGSLAKSL